MARLPTGPCERHSSADLRASAPIDAPVADGYELVRSSGVTPAEWRTDMARLHQRMSTDAPFGDVEIEAIWDEEIVAVVDARRDESAERLVCCARILVTGQLVGSTELERNRTRPQVVFQGDTLVIREHRGHGLGLSMKLANQHLAQQRWPEGGRVHTWNAGENDHIWAINEQLDFRTESISAVWQKKVT